MGATALVGAFMLPAHANLPGSTFEGNDGNYVVNTAGNTDWANAPNRVVGTDLINSQQDNSFGQGTAENDVNVTVISGSIPNSKADLSQFLVASEQGANGHTYLYLGWTRANQSGTTNFDFEINKLAQPDLTTPGSKTLNRSVGDLLVNYLFQGRARRRSRSAPGPARRGAPRSRASSPRRRSTPRRWRTRSACRTRSRPGSSVRRRST